MRGGGTAGPGGRDALLSPHGVWPARRGCLRTPAKTGGRGGGRKGAERTDTVSTRKNPRASSDREAVTAPRAVFHFRLHVQGARPTTRAFTATLVLSQARTRLHEAIEDSGSLVLSTVSSGCRDVPSARNTVTTTATHTLSLSPGLPAYAPRNFGAEKAMSLGSVAWGFPFMLIGWDRVT